MNIDQRFGGVKSYIFPLTEVGWMRYTMVYDFTIKVNKNFLK